MATFTILRDQQAIGLLDGAELLDLGQQIDAFPQQHSQLRTTTELPKPCCAMQVDSYHRIPYLYNKKTHRAAGAISKRGCRACSVLPLVCGSLHLIKKMTRARANWVGSSYSTLLWRQPTDSLFYRLRMVARVTIHHDGGVGDNLLHSTHRQLETNL